MKTYEEMAHSALGRIEAYEERRKQREKAVLEIAVPTVSFGLAAAVGLGLWQSGVFRRNEAVLDPGNAVWTDTVPSDGGTDTTGEAVETDITEVSEQDTAAFSEDETIAEAISEEPQETEIETEEIEIAEDVLLPDIPKSDMEEGAAVQPDAVEYTEEGGAFAAEEGTRVSGDTGMTEGFCNFWWKNKLTMDGPLYWKLQEDPEGVIPVTAVYRPATAEITSFLYEGKTLSELAIAAEEERFMPEKMMMLLKMGDDLKYGDALCETGNADGVKWDRNYYEDQVSFFGTLLDRYITDGTFLREELEADIAAYQTTAARDTYADAFHAYMESFIPAAGAVLSENGIQWERTAGQDNALTFYVTAQELENIPLEDVRNWNFGLASENVGGTQTDMPADDGVVVFNSAMS